MTLRGKVIVHKSNIAQRFAEQYYWYIEVTCLRERCFLDSVSRHLISVTRPLRRVI